MRKTIIVSDKVGNKRAIAILKKVISKIESENWEIMSYSLSDDSEIGGNYGEFEENQKHLNLSLTGFVEIKD